ncbi:MAG: DUF5011 domain-containing protein [Clostridiales bacterium]|nr:DUF5011 domain-containing protein [Clostridiales bacterium]MDD7387317.1 hypothetical protein [Bacillota bacterium]
MRKFRVIWLCLFAAVGITFSACVIFQNVYGKDGGPVIFYPEGVLEISVQDGEEALLQGVTAKDDKDGDVTGSILVEKLSGFDGENRREVTYAAFDSDGNVTKATREIVYTDYTPIRFQLNHSLRYRTGETINLSELVGASDSLDGDLSDKVKVKLESGLSTRTSGVYRIQFSVTNSACDTRILDTELEVYDAAMNEAVVNLTTYLIYYEDGKPDYYSYLDSVIVGGIHYNFQNGKNIATGTDGSTLSRSSLQIRSNVDPSTPGVYPVYLIYQDDAYQGMAQLMVVVE